MNLWVTPIFHVTIHYWHHRFQCAIGGLVSGIVTFKTVETVDRVFRECSMVTGMHPGVIPILIIYAACSAFDFVY